MSVSQVQMVVGDTKPDLVATLRNADGPQNLTGASVVARLKSSVSTEPILQVSMTIDEPQTAGVVRYEWQPADTDTACTYTIEFVVTFVDNSVQTWPNKVTNIPSVIFRARRTS